jgi:hypothetical protein
VGNAAPTVRGLELATRTGVEAALTFGADGSFVAFADAPITRMAFELRGRAFACDVEWLAGLQPETTCRG